MIAETATRETFANLPVWAIAFWYFLIFVSTGIFFWGVYRLARSTGRVAAPVGAGPPGASGSRGRRGSCLSHSWIRRRDPLSGFGHLFVFYGFLVLFVGTAILAVQDDVAEPLGFDFFKGWFYKGYSLFLDVFGAALVVGLIVLAVRRGIMKPFRLSTTGVRTARRASTTGRATFAATGSSSGLLFFLALTGFLLEAFRIAETDPSFEMWSPIGWLVGQGFIDIGFAGGAAESAHRVNWWVHGAGRARLRRLDPVHEGGAHDRGAGRGGRARREGRPAARADPSRTRSPRRSATSGSPISRRGTCSISTPARSAASATRRARRRRPAIRSRRAI